MYESPEWAREFLMTVEWFTEGKLNASQFEAEYWRIRGRDLRLFERGLPESDLERSIYYSVHAFVGDSRYFDAAAGNINAAELRWRVTQALERYRTAISQLARSRTPTVA